MNESDRFPSIDDPSMPGGQMPQPRSMPVGDTADNAGEAVTPVAELDLPGPDDPVAWRYVKPGTPVHGPGGEQLGAVEDMLGSDREDIFHGIAVRTGMLSPTRMVPADAIVSLTPSRVEISLDAAALGEAEEHRPPER